VSTGVFFEIELKEMHGTVLKNLEITDCWVEFAGAFVCQRVHSMNRVVQGRRVSSHKVEMARTIGTAKKG
jgi:hypothetical protein